VTWFLRGERIRRNIRRDSSAERWKKERGRKKGGKCIKIEEKGLAVGDGIIPC
jgi:hypothetical protein